MDITCLKDNEKATTSRTNNFQKTRMPVTLPPTSSPARPFADICSDQLRSDTHTCHCLLLLTTCTAGTISIRKTPLLLECQVPGRCRRPSNPAINSRKSGTERCHWHRGPCLSWDRNPGSGGNSFTERKVSKSESWRHQGEWFPERGDPWAL